MTETDTKHLNSPEKVGKNWYETLEQSPKRSEKLIRNTWTVPEKVRKNWYETLEQSPKWSENSGCQRSLP